MAGSLEVKLRKRGPRCLQPPFPVTKSTLTHTFASVHHLFILTWMSHRCASATAASASATLARTPAAWRSNALAAGAFTPAVREPTLPSPWALLLLLLPLGVSVGCPPAATEASDAARARAAAAVAFRDWASCTCEIADTDCKWWGGVHI
eukprot:1157365-Pelagomonas_calceolata.AAC.4